MTAEVLVMHNVPECRMLAFRYYPEYSGEIMMSAKAIYLDGTSPAPGTIIMCGCCKAAVRPRELSYADPWD